MTHKPGQAGFTVIELMVAGTVGLLLMTVLMTIVFDAMRTAEIFQRQIALNQAAREMFDILALGGTRKDVNCESGCATRYQHEYVFGVRGRAATASGHPAGMPPLPSNATTLTSVFATVLPAVGSVNADARSYWVLPDSIDDGTVSKTTHLMVKNSSGDPTYRLALLPVDVDPQEPPSWAIMSEKISVEIKCLGLDDPIREVCTAANTEITMNGLLRDTPYISKNSTTSEFNKRTTSVLLQLFDPFGYELSKRLAASDLKRVFWSSFTLNVDEQL